MELVVIVRHILFQVFISVTFESNVLSAASSKQNPGALYKSFLTHICVESVAGCGNT